MVDFTGNISQIRRNMGLSREAFAEPLKVSADKIRHIENGKQRADHEILAAIRIVYGIDLNALLTGEIGGTLETNPDTSFVQVAKLTVSETPNSETSFVSDDLIPVSYAFRADWIEKRGLDPAKLEVVEVRGDSMEPKLYHGDLILVDRAQNTPADGKLFAVRVGDEHVVKHVQRIGPDAISLLSANPVYPPRELALPVDDRNFEIIGRVVASMHEW